MTHTIYVAPNGRAMNGARIGRLEGGICVSTQDLSDAEIAACGLAGKVLPGTPDANRLYPVADSGYAPITFVPPLPRLPPTPR